jgi:phospholipid/cholesterol/gamma-HCH transport system permease protein
VSTPVTPAVHPSPGVRVPLTERVGAAAIRLLAAVGALSVFGARVWRDLLWPPYEVRETLKQLHELGVRSVPLIALSGLAIGVVLSMHTRASLERFGAEALIPAGLALALVKETGPLTAALLLSGRIGAGIGAELGAMKVTEQVDALEATAVDSFKFLVVTRVIACVIALPLLTTVMNAAGIVGGFLAERSISAMPLELYLRRAFSVVDFDDLIPATLKTAVFGAILATVSCYVGLATTGGTEGVGRASTRAVVLSSLLIIVVNVLLVRAIFVVVPGAAR